MGVYTYSAYIVYTRGNLCFQATRLLGNPSLLELSVCHQLMNLITSEPVAGHEYPLVRPSRSLIKPHKGHKPPSTHLPTMNSVFSMLASAG